MTDGQALYLTLIALTLLEALAWAPRGTLALAARSAARARWALPHRTLGNARGGAVLGVPLLPGAVTFLVPQWPVSLAAGGALGGVAECLEREERAPCTALLRSFEDMERVEARGREVRVDGELLAEAASPAHARRIAELVEALRRLPREARAGAVEAELAAQVDLGAARARVAAFYRETAALRAASVALAVFALAAAPALCLRYGLERIWPALLAALYVGSWAIAALFVRAHRRLLPRDRHERWASAVMIALLPVSAMRAADAIARAALHGLHPLAAAAALVPREELAPLLGHALRDARWPRRPPCPSDEPEAAAVEASYREALGRRLEALARDAGLDPDELTALPPPSGEIEGERCCPRCHARYAPEAPACGDCGGVPLAQA